MLPRFRSRRHSTSFRPLLANLLGGADRGLHYLQGGSSCPNSSWTEPSSDVHSSQATASTAGPATTCPFSPITPLGLSQLCKHRALCPHRSYPHPARTVVHTIVLLMLLPTTPPCLPALRVTGVACPSFPNTCPGVVFLPFPHQRLSPGLLVLNS